jgi:broad specificity phosphatase PhoE
MAKETDPLLSAAGTARAARLGTVLADAGIKAIYVTQFRRTQDTAKPLAAKLHLQVRQTPSSNEALATLLKSQHSNDIVLMVGHSNTIPAIIKALGGPDVTIDDDDFGSIFFIVPATKLVTRIHS